MSNTPASPPPAPDPSRPGLPPVQETEGISLMGALRNLDMKARPDLKRAVPALLVAILAFVAVAHGQFRTRRPKASQLARHEAP